MTPSDEHFARILLETRSIAMVGASVKPHRPSHGVGNYLASVGYRVLAVNPGHAGEKLFGETVRASLADIDIQIDFVSVFCRSDRVPGVVEAALGALPDQLLMQGAQEARWIPRCRRSVWTRATAILR